MPRIIEISPGFAVAAALSRDDFGDIARMGYRSVINNRPDGEDESALSSVDGAAEAAKHGLAYSHIPATAFTLFTDEVVDSMADGLAALPTPILAHCKSGLRSAIVWAAARARSEPVEDVLQALTAAGFDVTHYRDDLDSQAHGALWRTPRPAAATSPACAGNGQRRV